MFHKFEFINLNDYKGVYLLKNVGMCCRACIYMLYYDMFFLLGAGYVTNERASGSIERFYTKERNPQAWNQGQITWNSGDIYIYATCSTGELCCGEVPRESFNGNNIQWKLC